MLQKVYCIHIYLLQRMNHLDLFSGIGGFALAAKRTWEDDLNIVGFCEIEPYAKKVLNKIGKDVPKGFIITDKNSLLNKFRTFKQAVALKDIGINWHLRMRQQIEVLKQELETTKIKLKIAMY